MDRRELLQMSAGMFAAGALAGCKIPSAEARRTRGSEAPRVLDAAAFHALRRFVPTRFGDIAYVERGISRVGNAGNAGNTGDAGNMGPADLAALFLHGFPLNGLHWRGQLERLASHRRCLALDFMGLGYSRVPAEQDLSPRAQADMVAAFLDALGISQVDLIANDSGVTIAQLFVTQHPERVRTLLLTNGDVSENSPPAAMRPFIELARAGRAADEWLAPQLADKARARSDEGCGRVYIQPEHFTDEAIEYYFAPLLSSALRKAQFNRYAASFDPNPLPAIEADLRRCPVPARIVWGTDDFLFSPDWARWLDQVLPRSRGIRWVEGAKLFFPEEMPDLLAAEARALWGVGS